MVHHVAGLAVVDDQIELLRACEIDGNGLRRHAAADRRAGVFLLAVDKDAKADAARPPVESSIPTSAWKRLQWGSSCISAARRVHADAFRKSCPPHATARRSRCGRSLGPLRFQVRQKAISSGRMSER